MRQVHRAHVPLWKAQPSIAVAFCAGRRWRIMKSNHTPPPPAMGARPRIITTSRARWRPQDFGKSRHGFVLSRAAIASAPHNRGSIMCFGNTVTTGTKDTTTTLPGYLSNAAQANVANAGAVTSQPFTPYTRQMTAPMTADQNSATGLLRAVAGTSDPYTAQAAGAYGNLISAPAQSISAPSLLGPKQNVNTATIQDYMNPYLQASLDPTLQAIARQGEAARKTIDASATMSGAFGDARQGVESANQMRDENTLVGNTVGQAYNNAFNTAAGLRSQDIANAINTQNANAGYNEQALQRGATGASDLTNLDKYDTGRQVDLAHALEAQGATEQATNQAADTAAFNEFMRQQGYGPQMIQLMSQILAASPGNKATDVNATTTAPDNSGFGILGSLLGTGVKAALAPATGGASLLMPTSLGSIGGTGGLMASGGSGDAIY
jgi:hypothetical protein